MATAPGRGQPFLVASVLPLIMVHLVTNQVPAEWQCLTGQIPCECLLRAKASLVLAILSNNSGIIASVLKHLLLLCAMHCAECPEA